MRRLEPTDPPSNPPCGGNWTRDNDGGLTPADESTATAAGLEWAPAAPATPPVKANKE